MSRKILLFRRLNFSRCQEKNQLNNFQNKTTKHFSISHQTVHNKNRHLSKLAPGISEHITQNQSIRKIRKERDMDYNYHTRWLSTIHENDPRSRRWWYHGNDLTTGQKEILREKRFYSKIKSRQSVLCFRFGRGCVIINVSFIEFNLGY